MKHGNVLVIGNSGVGKSTLINSVLGEDCARTGWGTEGTTKELQIYENDAVPFRIIDSVGFEPSFLGKHKAINAVKKWSAESAKEENTQQQINAIWFCIDGTARKLFSDTIKSLSQATSMWESVPVIVVITKSYSVPEREENIQMVHNAFAKQKRYCKNLRYVIPVVASTYVLNDTAYAAPADITELIDATNKLLPEGVKAAELDIYRYKLTRKKTLAHSIVAAATTAGVVVGAVPIPFADAAILVPVETAEVTALARLYGINQDDRSQQFLHAIIEVGTVSTAARAAISALKAVPGLNLGASALNALIAGSIVAALGEGSILAFEQVYTGQKTVADIDWVNKLLESKISTQLSGTVGSLLTQVNDTMDKKDIAELITRTFRKKSDK